MFSYTSKTTTNGIYYKQKTISLQQQYIRKMYFQFKEISYLVRDLAIWLDNNSKLNFHQLQRYS